jgi:putative Mn2+ efflux pump MntP
MNFSTEPLPEQNVRAETDCYFMYFCGLESAIVLNYTAIIIGLLALSVESLTAAWYSGALHHRLNERQPLLLPLVLPLLRTLALLAGFFAGVAMQPLASVYSANLGFSVILIVSLKIMYENYRFHDEARVILVDNFSSLLLLSLSGALNLFLAGMGAGLGMSLPPVFLLLFFALLILSSAGGLLFGRKRGMKPFLRKLAIWSGFVLMVLAIRFIILQFI